MRRRVFLTLAVFCLLVRPLYAQVGCQGGKLTDPRAYFLSLVAGQSPTDYRNVMARIDADLLKYGIWQQRTSGGEIRGRLFLPYAAAGYVPRDPFYEHAVDVVSNNPPGWVWEDRGGPAYVAFPCGQPPPPPPPPPTDVEGILRRLAALEASGEEHHNAIVELNEKVRNLQLGIANHEERLVSLEGRPIWVGCSAGLFGLPVGCTLRR